MVLDVTRRSHQRVYQGVFGLGVLAVWIVAAWIWPFAIPYPWSVVVAFQELLAEGDLVDALVAALSAIVVGYLLAAVIGVPIGIAMGLSDLIEQFLDPYLDALYAMPLAALLPAMVIWFGSGYEIRVVVVYIFAVFPIVINTYEGAQSIPTPLYELSETFNAGRLYTIRNIIIPYEMPYILAGLRLGSGLAVRGLVVTELIVSITGFGAIITRWSSAFRMDGVFAVVIVLMLLGIGATWLLKLVEEYAIQWDVSVIEE